MANKDKVEVLRERLLYAAGKYSDYNQYWLELSNVENNYDETLEIYNFDIWSDQSHGTIREKAASMLRVTAGIFGDLQSNAEQELYSVMKEIMQLEDAEQLQICGVVVKEDELDEEAFENMLVDWTDYEYSQEKALESYLELLNGYMKR